MSDAPRWPVEGRGWPLAEHSRFVDAGGLRWHVQTLGRGPVLLLIHGTGAATHSWRGLAPLLAQHFSVVAMDLPGHGFTGRLPSGSTLPAVAAAIRALLDVLELRPKLFVGHSAGAAIGIRMALDGVATKGIVGLAPALQPFPGLAGRLFPSLAKLLFANPFAPHILAGIARLPGEVSRFLPRSTGSRLDDEGVGLYARLFARPGHVGGAIRMMADWDLATFSSALPGVKASLLLIHGTGDAAVPLDSVHRSAAAVPGARVAELQGLGHLAHEEHPDRVAALIEAFAAEIGVLEPATAGL